MKYCVIGHPIGHSLSPLLHTELFKASGITADYAALDIAPECLTEKISYLKTLNGFNVTIPNKSEIIPYLTLLDKNAEMIGAVNTVKIQNGELFGFNTDGYGFSKALEAEGIPLSGKVLLCGYGGAALAIAHEALKAGCSLTVGTRDVNDAKAVSFCKTLGDIYSVNISLKHYNSINENFDLAVNSTPVGMFPKTDASILTAEQVSRCSYIYDAVYNPFDTLLVKTAKSLNIKAASGIKMLVFQAAKAHFIWYGGEFSQKIINDISKTLYDKLTEAKL